MRKSHIKRSIGVLAGMMAFSVANAEVVVVVNPKNPVASLTAEQVADIYLGKTNTFPSGAAIAAADQAEGSGVRGEFYTKATGRSDAQVKAAWARITFTGKGTPPKELKSSAEVKTFVAGDANGIGYMEKSAADDSVKVVLTVQ